MPHPLPAGARSRHINQEWARAATATVREAKGPYRDGSYEYRVTTGEDFSRPTGPDNPETRETWWNSQATIPALARIQRRRTKGWRAPVGAVYVGRPTRYGNPFTVDIYVRAGRIGYLDRAEGRQLAAEDFRQWLVDNDHGLWCGPRSESDTARTALLAATPELRGQDLMCWCPSPEPGQPDHCHAAVLLDLANS